MKLLPGIPRTFILVVVSGLSLPILDMTSGQESKSPRIPTQAAKKKVPKVPEGVELVADLEYSNPEDGGDPLLLDLYLPKERDEKAPLPVVVWVHGGGWKNGSKDNCKASWLATEGIAVASINYRLTDRAQFPAQLDDCRNAVKWLRGHAGEYGLDAEHVGAWGSSAGGHLVGLMGTVPFPEDESPSSKVQAVCDWFGPSELLTMPPNVVGNGRTREQVEQSNGALLLGGPVPDHPEKSRAASPIENVSPDDCPFLIMHGDEDPGVPLEQSARFHEKLKAAGVGSTFIVVKGAGHGGPGFETPEIRAAVWSFFKEKLKPQS